MSDFTPRIGAGRFTRALVLENPDPTLDDHLRAIGIEPFRPETTPDEDQLVKLLENEPFDLLYKRSRVPVTARVLDAAPNLFGVMLCCIGDDSVDKSACAKRGVVVTNDPVSNARSVVEMVVGELISLSRRLFEASDELNRSTWHKSQKRRYEIQGKTLGVFGLGNIGKQVAQVCEALGMNIVFYDNREVAREVGETMGWRYVPSTRDLFVNCDYVTCHVSAFDYRGRSNEGSITLDDFAGFAERPETSPRIFLNLARGNIYASDDLNAAIEKGYVTRAMVDVYPTEPRGSDDAWTNPYANTPEIYGTPHIGAATLEAQPRIARHVAGTTRKLSRYGTLRNCVYAPRHIIGFDTLEGIEHILTVVHSNKRGTKKALADALYNAGASNLESEHRDFPEYGIAYECVAIDKPLNDDELQGLIREAAAIIGDPCAIRSLRQIHLD